MTGDTHTYHWTTGYGDDRQCYIRTDKEYATYVGLESIRKCDDPTHAQREET